MVEVHSLTDLLGALAETDKASAFGSGSELIRKMKERGFVFDVPVVFLAPDGTDAGSREDTLRLGETVVSFDSGTVERQGKVKTLTAKEYAILHKLAENRGKIVTIGALCDAL